MAHPLDGAKAKIARARQHFTSYKNAEKRFFTGRKLPLVSTRQEFDPDDESWVVRIDQVVLPPLRWATILGDFTNNLRGALDNMVYEIAFIDQRGQSVSGTAFPIATDEADFDGKNLQARIKALSKPHRAVIKGLQPYHGWNGQGDRHPLYVLADLSNDDKHRVVQPALIAPTEFKRQFPHHGTNCRVDRKRGLGGGTSMVGRPLEPDTEVARIPLVVTGPEPQMEVKCEASGAVGLRDGTFLTSFMEDAIRYVADAVKTVAPIFDEPAAVALQSVPRHSRFQPGPSRHTVNVTATMTIPAG